MKHIEIPTIQLSYPVGKDIIKAMNYVETVHKVLKPLIGDSNVNLWVRGSSGAILGALLAARIGSKAKINHVKKEGERSHQGGYSFNVDGINIILDDFIASGETVNKIYEEMQKRAANVDYLIVTSLYYNTRLNFEPTYIVCDNSFECLSQEIAA